MVVATRKKPNTNGQFLLANFRIPLITIMIATIIMAISIFGFIHTPLLICLLNTNLYIDLLPSKIRRNSQNKRGKKRSNLCGIHQIALPDCCFTSLIIHHGARFLGSLYCSTAQSKVGFVIRGCISRLHAFKRHLHGSGFVPV